MFAYAMRMSIFDNKWVFFFKQIKRSSEQRWKEGYPKINLIFDLCKKTDGMVAKTDEKSQISFSLWP